MPATRVVARFVIGVPSSAALVASVDEEAATHGDIVRVHTDERYDNLLAKTLAMLELATSSESGEEATRERERVAYVVKLDDDVDANVTRLLHMHLDHVHADEQATTSAAPLYYGFFHRRAFVHRHRGSRFFEPAMDDCATHLPYASGCGYVLSASLAAYLGRPPVPLRHFANEDTAVGFYLSPLAIERRDAKADDEIRPEREPSATGEQLCVNGAHSHERRWLQHRITPEELRACYRDNEKQKVEL